MTVEIGIERSLKHGKCLKIMENTGKYSFYCFDMKITVFDKKTWFYLEIFILEMS